MIVGSAIQPFGKRYRLCLYIDGLWITEIYNTEKDAAEAFKKLLEIHGNKIGS